MSSRSASPISPARGSRSDDSLDDKGFAYVPAVVRGAAKPCRVHVALHGCLQSYGNIGDDFVRHAGYNEWADNNHIIVLYPQIQAVGLTRLGITNPQACWDWWGYLDANPTVSPSYLLKSGQQIGAIKAMLDRLTSGAKPPVVPASAAHSAPVAVATDASDNAIDVVWSAVPGAVSYDVFRAGPGGQAFRQVGGAGGLSFSDSGLTPATLYRYKVRASAAANAGGFSADITRSTRAKVPACNDPGSCAVR